MAELAFGGDAVGRLPSGKVIFVPGGAPGDRALVRITREKKSLAWGEIEQLLEPGPGRRTAPCPLFGKCGGCQWQHLDYEHQLKSKGTMTAGILERLGVQAGEVIPSPEEFRYRRRARFTWVSDGKGGLVLGFLRARSKELLDVSSCLLLTPALEEELRNQRLRLASGPRRNGSLVLVEGSGDDNEISVSNRGETREGPRPPVKEVRLTPAEVGDFWGSAEAFCQANAAQEKSLAAQVAEMVPSGAGKVLELHAGVGALTSVLAPRCRSLVAVESSRVASAFLARNTGGLEVETRTTTAEEMLSHGEEGFDLVILDPPREGVKGLAPDIADTGASTVIYVSCDPMTLRRDAQALAKEGFKPTRAVALDMMPQTFHVESVARVTRSAQ